MVSESRQICGIPLWLMQEYLLEMGGTLVEEGLVEGDGWQVRLSKLEDFRLGSICVGQIQIDLSGDGDSLEQLKTMLEPKLMRAGG